MIRAIVFASLFVATNAAAQGQIIIVNTDGPGEGFNDTTPAAPVGGNPGTTLGQQRLNVFEHAADIWEAVLNPRNDVFVQSSFDPLAPNVLGSAGTLFVFSDFDGAEFSGTWYHSALADQLAGEDLNPGANDLRARFSSNFTFYLGLDHNHGTLNDLLPVVLHELGHGLGFANFVDETTGSFLAGTPDIYSHYTHDVTARQNWTHMATNAERAASAVNVHNVAWKGVNVNVAAPQVLEFGLPVVTVIQPTGLGPFLLGAAAFGPPLTSPGVTGEVVAAVDGAGAVTDACSPIVNDVDGRIALVDRGTCTFTVKVANAQAAGAIAVLVADNAPGNPPPGLGGVDPSIFIPSGRITQAAGAAIRANIDSGVMVTLGVDLSIRAGTNRATGLVLLAALDPVAPGSSISHFDASASRNLLMEPAINPDLGSSLMPPEDLTLQQMIDIGWFSDGDGVPDGGDACINSERSATVVIDGCDSGAPNFVEPNGCRISDKIGVCAHQPTHQRFMRCVMFTTLNYFRSGAITALEKTAIDQCARNANIP